MLQVITCGLRFAVRQEGGHKEMQGEVSKPEKKDKLVEEEVEGEVGKSKQKEEQERNQEGERGEEGARIGCSAVSPDGRLMALCDDFKQVEHTGLNIHSIQYCTVCKIGCSTKIGLVG